MYYHGYKIEGKSGKFMVAKSVMVELKGKRLDWVIVGQYEDGDTDYTMLCESIVPDRDITLFDTLEKAKNAVDSLESGWENGEVDYYEDDSLDDFSVDYDL